MIIAVSVLGGVLAVILVVVFTAYLLEVRRS